MITVTGLTKHYGRRVAVDDLTFDVAAGRVTGFVGPNGAGKSTTMRMMVGLTRPDQGDVRYDGVTLHPAAPPGPGRRLRARRTLHAPGPHRPQPPAGRRRAQRHPLPPGRRGAGARSGSTAPPTSGPAASRSACASASPSPAPCSANPRCCCSTSPPTASTPTASAGCATRSATSPTSGGTVFVSSHLIAELAMFADDLVVVGAGKLLAAEPLHATLARGGSAVVVRTPGHGRARPPPDRPRHHRPRSTATASPSTARPPPRCRRSRSTTASRSPRSPRPPAPSKRSSST